MRERPKFVDIDNRTVILIASQMKVAHTEFTKMTGMETLHKCTMMMHTTSFTTSTWMLSVLSYTTVSGRYVSAQLAGLFEASYLKIISVST